MSAFQHLHRLPEHTHNVFLAKAGNHARWLQVPFQMLPICTHRAIMKTAMTKDKLDAEERDILDRFERGELRSVPGAEHEIEAARQAARNTFNKTKRVNLRV